MRRSGTVPQRQRIAPPRLGGGQVAGLEGQRGLQPVVPGQRGRLVGIERGGARCVSGQSPGLVQRPVTAASRARRASTAGADASSARRA